MTALQQYDRLEASGLWRPARDEQRRDVIVALGDATLTLTSPSGDVLTHWSIPAIMRSRAEGGGALYHPDGDPGETLELPPDEATMIDALDRVLRAVQRQRAQPGKLRFVLLGGAGALLLGLGLLWLPGALQRTAVGVVPPVKRAEIGETLLDHVTRLTGAPCATPESQGALDRLAERVLGEGHGARFVVMRSGVPVSAHLPGRMILLDRSIFEQHEDAGYAAGVILAEQVRMRRDDPLAALLDHAGLTATLRLLTTGTVPDATLGTYAERLLGQAPAPVPDDVLLAAFDQAELSSTPYAYGRDVTGETVLPLIEADPYPEGSRSPAANDADWVRLQGICGA